MIPVNAQTAGAAPAPGTTARRTCDELGTCQGRDIPCVGCDYTAWHAIRDFRLNHEQQGPQDDSAALEGFVAYLIVTFGLVVFAFAAAGLVVSWFTQ